VSARRGFSLVEAVVALIIIATLAAVVTPGLVRAIDDARVQRGLESLETITTAILDYEDDINEYPPNLFQLVNELQPGDDDSCGNNLSNGERNRWDGPYLDRIVPTGGVPVGVGTALPALIRFPTGGNDALLLIVVNDVGEEDALALDRRVDGDGMAAGTVLWTPIEADGLVTLGWAIPINGC
jgi:prepilin-type N-terminal cleavage/methylation domain-containing protein